MAIIRTMGQRRIVVDVSGAAHRHGIRPGMTAAEARALCGPLFCFDDEPAIDRRGLDALGRWMTRFTPVVSSEWADDDENNNADPPAALWLDLTGCERLFGKVDGIAESVARALRQFNIPAGVAVTPTVGGAWAFACAARRSPTIVEAEAMHLAIQPLPVTMLRLNDGAVRQLHDLGLKTVGDVLALPRELLPARFGLLLPKRLDQLIGRQLEPLVGLVYVPPVAARHCFDAPIDSPENIAIVLAQLLDMVLVDLVRRGHGVRSMRLTFTPDRGWGKPIVRREITLSRPHRHRKTLLELIGRQVERIDCDRGFVTFQLDVPNHEPITEAQAGFYEGPSRAGEFELLLQRLRARLGEDAVIRPQLVESYLPERAWRPTGAVEDFKVGTVPLSPRPITLFPEPIEVGVAREELDDRTGQPRQFTWQRAVHRLVHIVGPERIGCEWWRGHRHTRDYFDVEDDTGRRFWIFRVPHVRPPDRRVIRWFLHGWFD